MQQQTDNGAFLDKSACGSLMSWLQSTLLVQQTCEGFSPGIQHNKRKPFILCSTNKTTVWMQKEKAHWFMGDNDFLFMAIKLNWCFLALFFFWQEDAWTSLKWWKTSRPSLQAIYPSHTVKNLILLTRLSPSEQKVCCLPWLITNIRIQFRNFISLFLTKRTCSEVFASEWGKVCWSSVFYCWNLFVGALTSMQLHKKKKRE